MCACVSSSCLCVFRAKWALYDIKKKNSIYFDVFKCFLFSILKKVRKFDETNLHSFFYKFIYENYFELDLIFFKSNLSGLLSDYHLELSIYVIPILQNSLFIKKLFSLFFVLLVAIFLFWIFLIRCFFKK